jgi:polysaccharide export outer membrane protein
LPTAARSSQAQSFRVDLVSATKGGANPYPLGDGAIVMVERRDPDPIYVTGLVTRAGKFDYPIGTELHLLDAIANAGNVSNQGANKVYIVRKVPGQQSTRLIEASIRDAKRHPEQNLKLAPGDVVSVEQTPTTIIVDTLHMLRFAVGTSLNTLF